MIPTVNTTLYTTVSLGGYGEALLLGNLIMIAALRLHRTDRVRWYVIWGLLSGLGLWAFGLTLVFVFPTLILLLYRSFGRGEWKASAVRVVSPAAAFFVGAAPWWSWAFQNGIRPLLQELLGSAISGATSAEWLLAAFAHTRNFILFGLTVSFGLRPPWGIQWLSIPLLPFALACWMIVLGHIPRRLRQRDEATPGRLILIGVVVTLIFGFIVTPFGADPSGRYFLPLLVPLALFAGETVEVIRERPKVGNWAYFIPAVILVYNLWGTLQSAGQNPPGITTQFDPVARIDHSFDPQLIDFLEGHGERRGYTNYWVAYPLAFKSDERLIFIPRLPYHEDLRYTSRDNRYSPYQELVEASDRVAYITTKNPALDARLRESFRRLKLSWEEHWIGDYHLYYALSSPVRPSDLGIEELLIDQ
jgi:hypothetical protein